MALLSSAAGVETRPSEAALPASAAGFEPDQQRPASWLGFE